MLFNIPRANIPRAGKKRLK
ncbi:hypothetical protein VTL71DRAFT_12258 [Oculimacula yallundae]|uniref:Uncharacterized protein n=1 Tax=Oculimacula yallundae TaxID=86028 RepID=A0ABR4BPI4_9HELO